MLNLRLFQLINAPAGLTTTQLLLPTLVAQWLIAGVPLGLVLAWHVSGREARQELLHLALAVALSLGLAQLMGLAWPHPRPGALHLGHQYLPQVDDASWPSDHVTVFWALAMAALGTRHCSVWGFPLLAAGLLVGWSRTYLGVDFPVDVLVALPLGLFGTLLAHLGGPFVQRLSTVLHEHYEAWRSHGH